MSEKSTQGSDSSPERITWYANLAPNVSDLNLSDFKHGLDASDEMFDSVQDLIIQTFQKHGLHKLRVFPAADGGPDYNSAVAEASAALLGIFEKVPEAWMSVWCEALILNRWQQSAGKEPEAEEGKQPALEDSPTTGGEPPKFAKQVPWAIASREYMQRPLPLDQMTFVLHFVTAPSQYQRGQHAADVLEIISTRCVPEGKDPKQVKNYRFKLFIDNFEEILNLGNLNRTYKLANGKLVYNHEGSGGGPGTSTRRIISSQQQFEVAIKHLLNNAEGDTVSFTFYAESSQQTRQRLEDEKQAEKWAQFAKLGKTKPENFRPREGAKAQATKSAKVEGTKTAASSTARVPSLPPKNPRRKLDPKKVTIGEPKIKPPSDPSRKRPVLDHTQKPKEASSSTPQRKPLDPFLSSLFKGNPSPRKTSEPAAPATAVPKGNSSITKKQGSPESATSNDIFSEANSSSTITKWPGRTGSAIDPSTAPVLEAPSLRRKNAINRGVAAIQSAARKTSAVLTGNPSEAKEGDERTKPKQKVPTIYMGRVRRTSDFLPQPQSPAINRTSTGSRPSTRGSISLPSGIKNILNLGGNEKAEERGNNFEDFYEEVSRKTFRRGGESEQELSIEVLKGSRTVIRDDEAEEQEEADDFESPDEYLVSR
jgi:hypothetical protein